MEWLVFLLPIAAFSGWIAARNHYKKKNSKNETPFNQDYFKGLNYLLNEQPDKAIDVFIHLLEVNSETVETHMALANLFRRRGETDRAIRIHQNLIARPTLTSEQRNRALVELGLDYMNAGVLDRAEHLFLELLTIVTPPVEAYKQLIRIYQQEKHWQKAIEMAKKYQTNSAENIGAMIAQFYCELAEQQFTSSPDKIAARLKQANSYDPNCVRASLLGAQHHLSNHNFKKALKTLHRIEQQNIHYLPEALPQLLEGYQQTNNLPVFNSWLESILKNYPDMTSIRLMLTHVIQLQYGGQAAQDYLYKKLHSHPSVEWLHSLISLGEQSNPILVPLIKNITQTLVQRGHRYTCQHCGFAGRSMHWQCPGCKKWATVRPTEIHLSSLDTLLGNSK